MASTTVVTSFVQESMMTFSVRSSCINCRSVSRPSISGIRTSRMMKSGRSPSPTRCKRFFAAGQRLDLVSIDFEQRPEIFPDARLVVDHHDLFFYALL